MDWKHQVTKTPYLVLFIVLITIGVGTASALITITLAGDVIITDNLHVGKDLFIGDSETNQDILFFDNGSPQGERFQWDDTADRFEFSDDGAFFGSLSAGSISSERPEGQNSGNFIVQRSGGPTSENTQFVLSHRNTNKDLWLYAYDGTAFKNFVGFDYPNYKIRFPSTGDTLVVDAANDQVTIEGKGFETPWNSRVPSDTIITTVDSAGDVGLYTSITIGVDGNPVISYYDAGDDDLKLVHCTNASCSTHDTPITLDSTGDVGSFTSIAIGVDGNPVISYYDGSPNFDLKLVHCTNASCSTHDTPVTLDHVIDDVGEYTSITIGVDGNPVISYYDATDGDLKVAKCNDQACVSPPTITKVDEGALVGKYTSIAIGVDGNPVISYGLGGLKVAKCNDQSCTSSTITLVDEGLGNAGRATSITIGVDGNPVISYFEGLPEATISIIHCTNPSCSTHDDPNFLETAISLEQTSITIGVDGFPVFTYWRNGHLLGKCNDQSCVSQPIILDVDTPGNGLYPSMAIGVDGNPVISSYDATNDDLKVAKCANPYCIPHWIRR